MSDLTPEQLSEARELLDSVPSVRWKFSTEGKRGWGTWSGEASLATIRAANVVLHGPAWYPLDVLGGIEAELRAALEAVAAHRRAGAPEPVIGLTIEETP